MESCTKFGEAARPMLDKWEEGMMEPVGKEVKTGVVG